MRTIITFLNNLCHIKTTRSITLALSLVPSVLASGDITTVAIL